jgi:GT2 family glycosyltransferase
MISLAIVCFWTLVGSIVAQSVMTLIFVRALGRWRKPLPADGQCPRAAVVLCLRGCDPFLKSCVQALLAQDYPHYDVRVVVDSRDDPAWRDVEQIAAACRSTNVRIEPLAKRRDTCSLKCSSLAQAVKSLDDSCEVLALLDADTVPHPTWLRELVAPLADPRVGAATGNRWYMPGAISWASLTRYLWNAAAVVQMYLCVIPWGGTLALKLRVLRRSGLLDRWEHAFCEDTMLYRAMRQEGLRVAFVPSLMMVNREACDMGGFLSWLKRQLLTARLYHPGWPLVVVHGVVTPLVLAAAAVLLAVALAQGNGVSAAWIGGGLACYVALLPCLLGMMESRVRAIVHARGEPTDWLSRSAAAQTLPAILLTQIVYPAGLVSSMFLRTVEWRGVRYRVDGPWQIRMIEYHPHINTPAAKDALTSL